MGEKEREEGKGDYGGIWGEEEGYADYGEMMNPIYFIYLFKGGV